jgi:hypothetical protein
MSIDDASDRVEVIFYYEKQIQLKLSLSSNSVLRHAFQIFAKSIGNQGFADLVFLRGSQRLFGEETIKGLQLSDGDCIFVEKRNVLDVV